MANQKPILRNWTKALLTKGPESLRELTSEQIHNLVVELQIHQIELEMQNQELQRSQLELEAARDKFSDLFDFAPTGYITISEKGRILEANLTFAAMIGVDRQVLIKTAFSRFVQTDDQDTYYHHRNQLFKTKTKQICELRLVKKDGTPFYTQLESVLVSHPEANGTKIRTAITNITHRKQAEEALLRSERELKAKNRIADAFLTFESDQVYQEVLDIALAAMGSHKGFFGYIDENGALACPTMTRDVWDQCRIPNKTIVFTQDQWGGVWGRSLSEKKTHYSNKTLSVPDGHIALNRALSVPILFQNEIIGLITVADKGADYDRQDINLLESIANFIAPVLKARIQRDIQERKRHLAEEQLQSAHIALEQQIQERTFELTNANEQLTIRIEELRLAEESLRKSEEKFRLLIKALPGVVYKGYKDWSVEFIDGKIEGLTGYDPDNFNSGRWKWSDIIVEEDLIHVKKSFIHALKTRTGYEREYRIIGNSGEIKWIQDRGVIIYDEMGDIEYISGVFFDITEQKAQKKVIQNTQRLLQTVFDGIPDPLVMLDDRLKVRILNEAAKHYYRVQRSENINGECCYQALMGKTAPCNGCQVPSAITGRKSGSFERIGIMDPNTLEQVTIYHLDEKDQTYGGTLIRIHDITEARTMERKVIHNEKLASLGLAVSSLTHEITNPISAITFNVPILKDYIKATMSIVDNHADELENFELFQMPYPEFREDAFKILENILHASQRINRTVSGLRRLITKKERPQTQWFNVKPVIERIVALLRFEINQYVKFFDINYAENLPEIYSDPNIIEQILINLLMNAAHAADKKDSRIILDAAPGDSWEDHLVIKVSDNGCGMDKDTLSKIFTPFFTTKAPGMGTGLGLYVCKDLIKDLSGRIEVESDLGKGSIFKVFIPDIERRSVKRL